MITLPSENEIPKSNPFDICMFINKDDKLLGYFTYLSYREYKVEWINEYKKKHKNDPTNKQIAEFKNNLHARDYESFVMKAEKTLQNICKQLLNIEIEKQLSAAVSKSNLSSIKELLDIVPINNDNTLKIGNAIYDIHQTVIKNKRKAFWRAVLTSALGSLGLILLFVFLDWLFQTGIFHTLYNHIVPEVIDMKDCIQ